MFTFLTIGCYYSPRSNVLAAADVQHRPRRRRRRRPLRLPHPRRHAQQHARIQDQCWANSSFKLPRSLVIETQSIVVTDIFAKAWSLIVTTLLTRKPLLSCFVGRNYDSPFPNLSNRPNTIQDAAGKPPERPRAARAHLPDGHVPRAARHDEAATQASEWTDKSLVIFES